jgi:hypothetical protein
MERHLLIRHRIALSTFVCGAAVLVVLSNAGCGRAGGATTTNVAPALVASSITIGISPPNTGLPPGASTTFAATVSGTNNTAVNWGVQETNGGTITSAGVYTAPAKIPSNPSTFHVIATSQADPSKQSTATVVVGISGQSVSGDISPNSPNVLVNGTVGFQAVGLDIGMIGWAWHWSVKEGAAGGTIVVNVNDPSRAVYTAPATAGTSHVVLVGETIETDPYGEPYLEIDATATITVLPEAKPGTFINTGSMTTARGPFTATLLHDGRVLIAGGDNSIVTGDGKSSPSTAEIYDPATGAFTATGNLTASRYGQSAVTLRDGRVLLVGGYVCIGTIQRCSATALASAEIYDPATGTFTATANMLSAHSCANALPLPNGKVLILGGAQDALTAEIYDPQTGTFTAASGSNSRELFKCGSAILLANGKALIAPNPPYYDDPGPSLLETFDAATGQYSTTPPISSPADMNVSIGGGTTLTLLTTGRVLVAGSEDTVCTSGGCETSAFDVAAWLLDPSSGSVQPTGSMRVRRLLFTHTLLQDGTVLLTGGLSQREEASAELYDPNSGTFSSVGNMSVARYLHTATLLNDGRVLVVGGRLGTSAELYYPAHVTIP